MSSKTLATAMRETKIATAATTEWTDLVEKMMDGGYQFVEDVATCKTCGVPLRRMHFEKRSVGGYEKLVFQVCTKCGCVRYGE